MAELIEFNTTNLLILLVLTNILWFWFVRNIQRIVGPSYFGTVMVAIRRGFKKPATFIKFFKSQYYELEVRDTTLSPTFDKNKKIPIKIDEEKRFNHEGPYKAYVLVEGATSNINPVQTDAKLFENIQRIGLINNYVLDIEKERIRKSFENELVTKKHFNIGIAIVLIGLVVIGALLYNVTTFTQFVTSEFAKYQPLIDEAIKTVPRIEPDLLKQVSNTVQPGSAP